MRGLSCIGSARRWQIGLAGLALIGVCVSAGATETFWSPPSKVNRNRMLVRETDDIALLLELRTEQRPALTAFLADRMPPTPPLPDADPDGDFAAHLRRMEVDTAKRFEDAGRRNANARAFYATLDARQRTAFEALMRLRQTPGGPGPEGFGPHRPGGPPDNGRPGGLPPGEGGPGGGRGPVR